MTQISSVVPKHIFLTAANGVTVARMLMGLTAFWWWEHDTTLTYIILFAAALSDGLDGWLARMFKQTSAVGVVLDPIADKLFVLPIIWLVGLAQQDWLLIALAAVTTLYDLINTFARRYEIEAAFLGFDIGDTEEDEMQLDRPVSKLSKVKTALQFVLIFTLIPTVPELAPLATMMMSTCLVLTVACYIEQELQARKLRV
jgi:phosphatidylglycerophosphate synthase